MIENQSTERASDLMSDNIVFFPLLQRIVCWLAKVRQQLSWMKEIVGRGFGPLIHCDCNSPVIGDWLRFLEKVK